MECGLEMVQTQQVRQSLESPAGEEQSEDLAPSSRDEKLALSPGQSYTPGLHLQNQFEMTGQTNRGAQTTSRNQFAVVSPSDRSVNDFTLNRVGPYNNVQGSQAISPIKGPLGYRPTAQNSDTKLEYSPLPDASRLGYSSKEGQMRHSGIKVFRRLETVEEHGLVEDEQPLRQSTFLSQADSGKIVSTTLPTAEDETQNTSFYREKGKIHRQKKRRAQPVNQDTSQEVTEAYFESQQLLNNS
jgi:hypothetical protein